MRRRGRRRRCARRRPAPGRSPDRRRRAASHRRGCGRGRGCAPAFRGRGCEKSLLIAVVMVCPGSCRCALAGPSLAGLPRKAFALPPGKSSCGRQARPDGTRSEMNEWAARMTTSPCDVLIAGGGTAGLCAALAIAQERAGPCRRGGRHAARAGRRSGRARLGRRRRRAAHAGAARRLAGGRGRVRSRSSRWRSPTAARATRCGRCSSPSTARRPTGEPFAHMVPNNSLLRGARRGGAAGRGPAHPSAMPWSASPRASAAVTVGLAIGRKRAARSSWSPPTASARGSGRWPASRPSRGAIAQTAIVATVGTSGRTTAWRSSIFCRAGRSPSCRSRATARRWSGRSAKDDADRLLAADDFVFLVELERRFGHRLGQRWRSTARGRPFRSD